VISAANIHYELAEKTHAIAAGGIGMIQLLVKRLGLDEAITDAKRTRCAIRFGAEIEGAHALRSLD